MSASSVAANDDTANVNVSSSSTISGTSSYANIVQKDNGDKDKDKSNVKTDNNAAKKLTANTTNATNNNKTEKSKESIINEPTAGNPSNPTTSNTNEDKNDIIDAEDDAFFTPVVSHNRKDRNNRRNKVNY